MPHGDVGCAAEGRAWWAELQRQRVGHGRHVSSGPGIAAAVAAAACPLQPLASSGGGTAGQPEPHARSAALVCRAQALLQLMSGPDVGSDSRACYLRQHAQQPRPAAGGQADGLDDEPAANDDEHWAELLRGGLISKANAASDAWRTMQREQMAAEQQEWQRQLERRVGPSLHGSCPSSSPSSPASRCLGGANGSPLNPAPERRCAAEAVGGEGSWDCSSALPATHLTWSTAAGNRAAAAAAFQLGSIADSEVRHHLTALLLRGEGPCLGPPPQATSTASQAAGAAGQGGPPGSVGAQPSALAGLGSAALLDPYSAVATAGGDVGRGVRDPLLQAWLVTRTQPDLPIRGYSPPPSRAACRLVAAEEMIQFYRRQRRTQGCFFQHLRLSRRQAGRGASETDSVELLDAEEDPVIVRKRSSLRAAASRASIDQSTEGALVPEGATHSPLREWAREHCRQVESAAEEQLRTGSGRDAEAAPPAVAGCQQPMLGAAVGNPATQEQRGDSSAAVSMGSCKGSAAGSAVTAAAEPQPQQVTQQRQQDAEALPSAAEQLAERERRRAASQALQKQWDAVRLRLPDCALAGP